ncbi:MAG: MBL fold metallo-hydrolase [Candidatus Moranbacteria bacterium]|nr:MBL fold metallo-hydrolase [Candidatus Moranbacteria bacterium]
MNIQYYGDFCFKISTKPAGRATEDIIIWTDPLQKGAGLRSPQGQVDLVFLSHEKKEDVQSALKDGTIIFDAPGEYASKGVSALGFQSYRDAALGAERGQNTIFTFESEDIHVCYLGALGHDITPELLEKLNGVDVLFIPIGGADTISAKVAAELVRKIEPSIVIPMHYMIAGLTLPLETEKAFCNAIGNCPMQALPKLNIKKKDLEGKPMEVVLLERGV